MNILLIFPGFILAFIIVLYYERKIRNLSVKPKNKVHFYMARDDDGGLYLFMGKPIRGKTAFFSDIDIGCLILTSYSFESFGLNRRDFNNLRWEDEPVEVFLNMEEKS